MPAFLLPDGKKRLVVDRVFALGGGRMVCELQGQFFSMTGAFLRDMTAAEALPEPHRARAIKFVKEYQETIAKEADVPAEVRVEVVAEPGHPMSEELRRVLDVRTSEERAQGG